MMALQVEAILGAEQPTTTELWLNESKLASLSQEQEQSIHAQTHRLYAIGTVRYLDIFREIHTTTFCFSYPYEYPYIPGNADFMVDAPEYNQY